MAAAVGNLFITTQDLGETLSAHWNETAFDRKPGQVKLNLGWLHCVSKNTYVDKSYRAVQVHEEANEEHVGSVVVTGWNMFKCPFKTREIRTWY